MQIFKEKFEKFAHKHNILGYYDFESLVQKFNNLTDSKKKFLKQIEDKTLACNKMVQNTNIPKKTLACNKIFPDDLLDIQREIIKEIESIDWLLYNNKISSKYNVEYEDLRKKYKDWIEHFEKKFTKICEDCKTNEKKIKEEINQKNPNIQKVDSNNLNTDTEYYIYDFENETIKKVGKFVQNIYNTFYEPIATRTGSEYVVEYLFNNNGVETKVSIKTELLVMVDATSVNDANRIVLEEKSNEGGKPKKTRRHKNKKRRSSRRHKK